MINEGRRHAAMKNNAHETISKRYVAQDSSNLTLTLDRSNSAAAISQAASGSATPTINIRIENWIERVKCIATSRIHRRFSPVSEVYRKYLLEPVSPVNTIECAKHSGAPTVKSAGMGAKRWGRASQDVR